MARETSRTQPNWTDLSSANSAQNRQTAASSIAVHSPMQTATAVSAYFSAFAHTKSDETATATGGNADR